MTVYETARLVIREWTDTPADLTRLYAIYSRWEVARWLGATPQPMADVAEAGVAVRRWHRLYQDSGRRYGAWAVQVRATGVAAGTVLFKELSGGDGEVEVGWHLHPDSWGHGYATEAARAAIERGFAAGLPEVWAVVRPGNDASIAVCRRLGMTHLGQTTRWYGLQLEQFRLAADGGRRPPAADRGQ